MPTVPSSTSSSELRPPPVEGAWSRTWLGALLCVLVLLGGWESWLRANDFEPQTLSGPSNWARAASALQPHDDLVVGSSRELASIHPETWTARRGRAPVNLSVQAGSPLPILAWLARETDFRGLVVVGISPSIVFSDSLDKENASRAYLDAYAEWTASPAKRSEALLDDRLGRALAMRGPSVDLDMLLHSALQGRALVPPFIAMRPGRWLELDSKVPTGFVEAQLAATQKRTPAYLSDKKQRVDALVVVTDTLTERGATVVFVNAPTSKGVEDYEREHWPRERYWERLPLKTGLPALHHADDPRTADMDPPDGSHLSASDAAIYTEVLLERIEAL